MNRACTLSEFFFVFLSLCVCTWMHIWFRGYLPAEFIRKKEDAYFYVIVVDRSLSIFHGNYSRLRNSGFGKWREAGGRDLGLHIDSLGGDSSLSLDYGSWNIWCLVLFSFALLSSTSNLAESLFISYSLVGKTFQPVVPALLCRGV